MKHGYKTRPTVMKKHDGFLLTESKETVYEFNDMFEKLLNQPDENITVIEYSTVEQLLEKSSEEVKIALNMLKNRKASGADKIVSECLKKGGKSLLNQLYKLMNTIWKQEEILKAWRIFIICPLHKKGDIMDCENFRWTSIHNIHINYCLTYY